MYSWHTQLLNFSVSLGYAVRLFFQIAAKSKKFSNIFNEKKNPGIPGPMQFKGRPYVFPVTGWSVWIARSASLYTLYPEPIQHSKFLNNYMNEWKVTEISSRRILMASQMIHTWTCVGKKKKQSLMCSVLKENCGERGGGWRVNSSKCSWKVFIPQQHPTEGKRE